MNGALRLHIWDSSRIAGAGEVGLHRLVRPQLLGLQYRADDVHPVQIRFHLNPLGWPRPVDRIVPDTDIDLGGACGHPYGPPAG